MYRIARMESLNVKLEAIPEVQATNVVKVGRSSIVLQRNAQRLLEDAKQQNRSTARKSIHFENYEQRLSILCSPPHIVPSQHWSVLMRDMTIKHDMPEFLEKLRASKLRAMKLKQRLIKAVRRLILQRAVQRMKKRLELYNQQQKSRQTLLKMQSESLMNRRAVTSRDSFTNFWRRMRKFRGSVSFVGKFDESVEKEILRRWMKQHHLSSTVWSLFDEGEIDELFKTMEWSIKIWNYGTAIFKKGDDGKYFYTILDGEISLWILKDGIVIDTNPPPDSTKKGIVDAANKAVGGFQQTPHEQSDMGKWEKILTLQSPVSFGELALFPNGTGKRNASCVARNQCLMLLIDKENYLRFIHERIMRTRNERARLYSHFKRNTSAANLEKLVIIASIGMLIRFVSLCYVDWLSLHWCVLCVAIEQIVEALHVIIPDRIHAAKDEIHFDKQSVYLIKEGTVGLCFSSEKKRDLTLQRGRATAWSSQHPFLELGPGSIVDCRVLYEVGMTRFGSKGVDGFDKLDELQMRDYDRIYYIAKTQVILQKFKLNTFVQIGNFDLFALCRVAKMELYLVMERYNEHKQTLAEMDRKRILKRTEVKGEIRRRRLQNPGILRSSMYDKSPLELYQMKEKDGMLSAMRMSGTNPSMDIVESEQFSIFSAGNPTMPLNLTGTMNRYSTPLPPPLKIIRVPRNELPAIFL